MYGFAKNEQTIASKIAYLIHKVSEFWIWRSKYFFENDMNRKTVKSWQGRWYGTLCFKEKIRRYTGSKICIFADPALFCVFDPFYIVCIVELSFGFFSVWYFDDTFWEMHLVLNLHAPFFISIALISIALISIARLIFPEVCTFYASPKASNWIYRSFYLNHGKYSEDGFF